MSLYNYTLETCSQSFAAVGFLATLLWVPEAMSLPVDASTICTVSKIDRMSVIPLFRAAKLTWHRMLATERPTLSVSEMILSLVPLYPARSQSAHNRPRLTGSPNLQRGRGVIENIHVLA